MSSTQSQPTLPHGKNVTASISKNEKKVKNKGRQQTDENGTILVKPPKSIGANKEHYQRINYLYQLSTWQTMFQGKQDKDHSMARMYNRNLDLISKKIKCNLSANIKRTICKKCKRTLIPCRTSKQYIRNLSKRQTRKNDDFIVKCICGEEKIFRIGLNRSYQLEQEKEGNLINIDT